MEGTRLRILQLLQRHENDTVDGLAKKIGLAPATVRRHLDILQRDRLVDFDEVRKKTGRPEYSFYLTEEGHEALPKNYDTILKSLVGELVSLSANDVNGLDGKGILSRVFEKLSDRTSALYSDELSGKSFEERLLALIEMLRSQDFYPEAEVVESTLQINLLNCPFRSLALQNDAICSFDSNLIGSVLDVPISREKCVHDGEGRCLYVAELNTGDVDNIKAALGT